MYVLDRTSGQFLMGKPFVKVNWMDGFDEKGRPKRVPGIAPSKEGTLIMPTVNGGTNWYPPSYSPRTELFYIPGWENTGSIAIEGGGQPRTVGNIPPGAPNLLAPNTRPESEGYGFVRAFDMKTGERKWEFKMNDVTYAGVLSTASDLVFSGGREGYFYALNARSGELLWRTCAGRTSEQRPDELHGRRETVRRHSRRNFAIRVQGEAVDAAAIRYPTANCADFVDNIQARRLQNHARIGWPRSPQKTYQRPAERTISSCSAMGTGSACLAGLVNPRRERKLRLGSGILAVRPSSCGRSAALRSALPYAMAASGNLLSQASFQQVRAEYIRTVVQKRSAKACFIDPVVKTAVGIGGHTIAFHQPDDVVSIKLLQDCRHVLG
jgi:hypothetical protein